MSTATQPPTTLATTTTPAAILEAAAAGNPFIKRFLPEISAAMTASLAAAERKMASAAESQQVAARETRKMLNADRAAKLVALKAAGPPKTPAKRDARKSFVAARLAVEAFVAAYPTTGRQTDATQKKGATKKGRGAHKQGQQQPEDPAAAKMAAAMAAGLEPLRRKVRAATDQPTRKQARAALMVAVIRIRTEFDQKRKAARAALDALPKDAPAETRSEARKVLIAARTAMQTFTKSKPGRAQICDRKGPAATTATASAPVDITAATATTGAPQKERSGTEPGKKGKKLRADRAAADVTCVAEAAKKAAELSANLEPLRAAVKAAQPGPARKQARAALMAAVSQVKAELDTARKTARERLDAIPKQDRSGRVEVVAEARKTLVTARATLHAFGKSKPGKVDGLNGAGAKRAAAAAAGDTNAAAEKEVAATPPQRMRMCGQRVCGALPPPWLLGQIEAPAGVVDMGSWTRRAYTTEQQSRLGVDENGKCRLADAAPEVPSCARAPEAAVVPTWVREAQTRGQSMSAALEPLRAAVNAATPGPERKQARATLMAEVNRKRVELDTARKAARAALNATAKGATAATKAAKTKALVTARTTLQAFCKSKPGQLRA